MQRSGSRARMVPAALARTVLAGTVLAGTVLALSACSIGGGAGESLPSNDVVWDGEQFVVSNNVIGDGAAHWVSADGSEWERREGVAMADVADLPCVPGFPCELEPDAVEEVPYHYALPQSHAVAGRGDILIQQVWTAYQISRSRDGTIPDQLHPGLLAEAAEGSDCFAVLLDESRGGDDPPTDSDGAYLSSWGVNGWELSATCTRGGEADTYSVDLAERLTDGQRGLVEGGAGRQLVVTRTDGTVTPINDPPTTTWTDDVGTIRSDPSPIVATSTRFWSVDEGVLVASVDGLDWAPVEIDTEGMVVRSVLADHGGDLALILTDGPPSPDEVGPSHLAASHDDGASWGRPVALPEGAGFLIDVGPAGVAVAADTDRLLIVDDATGAVRFTLGDRMYGLLADVGIGVDTVVVPQIVSSPGGRDDAVLEVYDLDGNLLATVE